VPTCADRPPMLTMLTSPAAAIYGVAAYVQ
jgi:hypothetical protein